MEYVIKIVGCAILALLCVAVPMLTVLSVVFQWSGFVFYCLMATDVAISLGIFSALMDVE